MAPDSASLYASTIDTESVQSHSALYQPTLPLADLPKPNLREPKLDAYSVEADTPSHPSEGTLDALPDTGRIARRAFDPLPGLGTSKLPVMPPAATKLKTPRVVSQILADAPTHWKSLAEAIAARVQEAGLKSLMVASALRGEGVTTVATALAIAVAQHGPMKVCLVDGNFSHPALANTLRLTARVGMEHHLRDNVALADTIVSFEKISLAVLPTLEAIDLPNVVLGMEKLKEVIGRLTQTYDLVIVDQGSLFSERKPTHLPEGIDATLLVRDPSKCSPELLDQLDGYVARHQISSLGVIENGVDDE
jgi:Mrp family chromosome partitioning ATPase